MRLFLLIISGWLIWTSCSNEPAGSDVIQKNKFVDVLVDIHMADATLIVEGLLADRDSTLIRNYYNTVLIKHEVTQKQLESTFTYYAQNPRKFEKIYEQVTERLVKLQEQTKDSVNMDDKE